MENLVPLGVFLAGLGIFFVGLATLWIGSMYDDKLKKESKDKDSP